ncbi:MAG: glycosyltransferase family 4 protein, partial [Pseudomonadota bacterium]|nr:glycosyltransferase family 4 protein [Pseudomonadota bacterium]
MHLVFDLFACQTASRLRGIGRYTQSLAEAMLRQAGDHAVTLMRDATPAYRDSAEALRQAFRPLVPRGRLVSYSYPPRSLLPHDALGYEAVASTLIHHAWRSVGPDAIVSNPFEGWCESGIEPLPASYGTALQVALVYDFIPYLFAEHYLTDPAYKAWYLARLAALGRFDLLLAISEATRQDAIRILGIEPERVINISGAVSPLFQPVATPPAARFDIRKPFVLYTGNADYRKNQTGMLHAYAALPPALRASHQLVLNQVGSLSEFWRTAAAAGLHRDEVVVTGHITDAELTSLYSHCALFVFPSLYEGFGLPILEAMSCGAPVLAADNSSMPELVGDPAMMFDASQPETITAAMVRALTDPAWRAHLCAYGKKRAGAFSWDRCARLAWQAIQSTTPRHVPAPQRMRIALVAELSDPTLASTQHMLQYLPLLADYVDIDYFTERATFNDTNRPGVQQCYPAETLLARRAEYATMLWQFDDQPTHAFMLPLMLAWPGVFVPHAARCDVALAALDQQPGHAGCLHAEILAQCGLQGLLRSSAGDPPALALPMHGQHELVDTGADATSPGAMLTRYRRALAKASANDTQHTAQRLAQALHGVPIKQFTLDAISAHASSNAGLAA